MDENGVINMPDIKKAQETLEEYKKGRKNLEARIRENERWYKLRHWEMAGGEKNPGDPEPASAWLLNSLANKHADAMDNYPEPAVLPREEGDRETAQILSSVIPTIMEQQRFEDTYDLHWWRKLRSGTAVYGVFWDNSAHNGIGDVAIKDVDLLSLYWEPGQNDIQKSRNVFLTTMVDNDALLSMYPQLESKLGDVTDQAQYIHDESIDTSKKTVVVDWYYKKAEGTKTVLHYCKFVGETVLYSSEDEEARAKAEADVQNIHDEIEWKQKAESGIGVIGEAYRPKLVLPAAKPVKKAVENHGFYNHGLYPFVFDTLFPVEGSPAGFGWLDVCKDPQMYIDKLNQAILKNAIWSSRPRFFSRNDSGINEAEYADLTKDIVHFNGGDPRESIMPIEVQPLNNIYATILASKVDELKETSGNRDFSQGGTSGGVSAASAIAALQEAGSKLSRDMIRASYRAYEQVCRLVLELIRQFYDEARTFRITGAAGMESFVRLDNSKLGMRPQGDDFGIDMGMAEPVFDIKIRAQKRNAFSTIAQNEMAKEFFAAGFFNPQLADQALACLEMMDFEGKQQVEQRIQQNSLMLRQMAIMEQQMMQMTDVINGMTGGRLGQIDQAQLQTAQQPRLNASAITEGGGGDRGEKLANRARERAQNVAGVK